MQQITVSPLHKNHTNASDMFVEENPGLPWVKGMDRSGAPYWRAKAKILPKVSRPPKGVEVTAWQWVEGLTSGGETFNPH